MTTLGGLLELVYAAHDQVRSLEVEYRDWARPKASRAVVVERGRLLGWKDGGPWPSEVAASRRIWLQAPDRMRVEVRTGGELVRFGVLCGAKWWVWDSMRGAVNGETGVNDHGLSPQPFLLAPPLFEPLRLIAPLRVEVTGTRERAGRKVVSARAQARFAPADDAGLSYDFEFDYEHGTVLSRAIFDRGTLVQATEAREVRYGSAIDPDRFVFVPPGRTQTLRVTGPPTWPATRRDGPGADATPAGLAPRPATLWMTGFPGAGKTTIAYAAHRYFARHRRATHVLDDKDLRRGLNRGLALSRGDYEEHARRAAHAAIILAQAGVIPIVALATPYAEDHRRARELHEAAGVRLCEIRVDTPVHVCENRSHQTLEMRGPIGGSAGLSRGDAAYELPERPELRIDGYDQNPDEVAEQIASLVTQVCNW